MALQNQPPPRKRTPRGGQHYRHAKDAQRRGDAPSDVHGAPATPARRASGEAGGATRQGGRGQPGRPTARGGWRAGMSTHVGGLPDTRDGSLPVT